MLTGNHARIRRGANVWRRIYLNGLHNASIHPDNLASAASIKRRQIRSPKVRRRAVIGKRRREHASKQPQVVQLRCVDARAVEMDNEIVCAGQLLKQVQLGPRLILGLKTAILGHNNVGALRQREAQLVVGLWLVGFGFWPPTGAGRFAGDEADVLGVDEEVDGLLVAAALVALANDVAVELENGRVGRRVGVQVERQVEHLPRLAIGGPPRHSVLSVRDIDNRRGFKVVVAV